MSIDTQSRIYQIKKKGSENTDLWGGMEGNATVIYSISSRKR